MLLGLIFSVGLLSPTFGDFNYEPRASGVSLPVPTKQQEARECGQVSLAMVLEYWEHYYFKRSTTFNPRDLFRYGLSVGTAPQNIVQTAEKKSYLARMYNQGEIAELIYYLDQGIPLLSLMTWDEGLVAGKAHWLVVTGYLASSTGAITDLRINNSTDGQSHYYRLADFLEKWQKQGEIADLGFDRFFIAIVPPDKQSLLKPEHNLDEVKLTNDFLAGLVDFLNTITFGCLFWERQKRTVPDKLLSGILFL